MDYSQITFGNIYIAIAVIGGVVSAAIVSFSKSDETTDKWRPEAEPVGPLTRSLLMFPVLCIQFSVLGLLWPIFFIMYLDDLYAKHKVKNDPPSEQIIKPVEKPQLRLVK